MTGDFKQMAMALERLREEHERVKAELRAKVINTELRGYDGLVDEMAKLREENERLKKANLKLINREYRAFEEWEKLKASNAELVGVLKTVQHISWKYDGNRWGIIEDVLKTNQGGE